MISIELIGRLGNQMFQYAICRTIAEKNGYDYHIPREKSHGQNLSDYFNLDMGQEFDETIYDKRIFENHLQQDFNPTLFNIEDGTKLWGFYQSDKYFKDNERNIKQWFKVETDDFINSILELYPIDRYCYIHLRGCDYKDWDGGKRYLPEEYFNDAITYVKKIYPTISFLVITDDVQAARELFDFDIISNDMMIDFKLLYCSKICIIPNSTFSWWASWLSEKQLVIAPDNWLNYNSPQLGFYPADIKTEKFSYI